ncbi:MAG TPA: HD domain-containing phosphohydrolase [Phycisphaerae bacterium]
MTTNPSDSPSAVATPDSVEAAVPGRYGYLPVPLRHVPAQALDSIPVFMRTAGRRIGFAALDSGASGAATLDEGLRRKLLEAGTRFVYIQSADQLRFRRQMEACLEQIVADAGLPIGERCAVVYGLAVELTSELLADPNLGAHASRVERVARAIVALVTRHSSAPESAEILRHLFSVAHHDDYEVTHMVNVAVWMVPTALALGHQDPETLLHVCQAGLLHDIGNIQIPGRVLRKRGPLSRTEWEIIRLHPELGAKYLSRYGFDPLVLQVTREHHERFDGSGYPAGLSGVKIHPISRVCAVIDSFDAMTAVRPYKRRTLTVRQAIAALQKDTPAKYDPEIVAVWVKLLGPVQSAGIPVAAPPAVEPADSRRRYPRYRFHCAARLHVLEPAGNGWQEGPPLPATAHSISQSGLGVLSRTPLKTAERVRVYLDVAGWSREFLEGETVRCRPGERGWHEIGIMLISPQRIDSEPRPCASGAESGGTAANQVQAAAAAAAPGEPVPAT